MARKRRRMHRRYKRNRSESAPRSNPPLAMEIVEYLAPGFGGFAATRVLTRLAAVQIARWKPSWGKHAGVLASAVAFGAAWWGAHRVKLLEKYATPITVGAGIAALQSVFQLWLPKIGWLIGDPLPALAAGTSSSNLAIEAPSIAQMTAGMTEVADPSSFTMDESYEAESYAQTAKPAGPPRTEAAKKAKAEEDLLVDLNLDEGMGGGIFAN